MNETQQFLFADRYFVEEELGKGAMGTVYKARDVRLKRVLALKVVNKYKNAKQNTLERFEREAQALSKLNHPNIITLYEYGKHQQTPYFTMEIVKGQSLAELLKKKKRLSCKQAIKILLPILNGISHAHEQGVIHRDLKPENIMLADEKRPLIMDFGIAKMESKNASLTQTGTSVGTPAYMSPEQAEGLKKIDFRTDIYSLGVIFYELIVGKRPFTGSVAEVMWKIASEEPKKPSLLNKNVSKELDKICLKAMAKEPDKRYQTSKEMAIDLEKFLLSSPTKTALQKKEPKKYQIGMVGVIILVLFFVFFPGNKVKNKKQPLVRKVNSKVKNKEQTLVSKKSQNKSAMVFKSKFSKQSLSKRSKRSQSQTFFSQKNALKDLAPHLKEPVWSFISQTNIRRTCNPVFGNNVCYLGTNKGIYVIDLENGKLKKHIKLQNIFELKLQNDYIFALERSNRKRHLYFFHKDNYNEVKKASPKYLLYKLHNGIMYLRKNKLLCAQSVADNKILWEVPGYKKIVFLGENVYVVDDENIYKLKSTTGKTLWKKNIGKVSIKLEPLLINNTLYLYSNNHFFAVDDRTGNVLWKKRIFVVLQSFKKFKNYLYLRAKNKISVLHIENGKTFCTFDFKTKTHSILANESGLYCATRKGIYAINQQTGQQKWFFATPYPVHRIAFYQNHLYFLPVSLIATGYCHVLNVSGEIAWFFKMQSNRKQQLSCKGRVVFFGKHIYFYGGNSPTYLFAFAKIFPKSSPKNFTLLPLPKNFRLAHIHFSYLSKVMNIKSPQNKNIAWGTLILKPKENFTFYFILQKNFPELIFQFSHQTAKKDKREGVSELEIKVNDQLIETAIYEGGFLTAGYKIHDFVHPGENKITLKVKKTETYVGIKKVTIFALQ